MEKQSSSLASKYDHETTCLPLSPIINPNGIGRENWIRIWQQALCQVTNEV